MNNSLMASLVFAGLVITANNASACRPVAGLKTNSLEENFKAANAVFIGTVAKQSERGAAKGGGGIEYDLEMTIEKFYKGTPTESVKVHTTSNTCNPLGQFASPGSHCLILLDSHGEAISGVTAGVASSCSPRDLNLVIADFEKAVKGFKK